VRELDPSNLEFLLEISRSFRINNKKSNDRVIKFLVNCR